MNQSLIIICFLSIWGSIVYRFYALDNLGIFLTIILTIISFIIVKKTQNSKLKTQNNNLLNKFNFNKLIFNFNFTGYGLEVFLFYALYFAFLSICLYVLFASITTKSIVSPWQVVPWYFFVVYFFTTYILIIYLNKKKLSSHQTIQQLLLFTPFFFLSFGIVLVIYELNYGFDPFIHQATINLINEKGFVDPKPLYYLGQYSLELIFHKTTNIPLFWIDKLLVPLLASVYLPIMLCQAFKGSRQKFADQKIILLTILSVLIVPFSFFIVTTPQNLSYLFLIMIVILGISSANLFLIFLLALAAFVTQPIAGIPALLFACAVAIFRLDFNSYKLCLELNFFKIKKYLYILIFITTIFILPLLFYILEKGNTYSQVANASNSSSLNFSLPRIIIPDQDNVILNFVYLYTFNFKFFIFFFALVGLLVAWQKKENIYFIYFGASLALFLSYLITTYLPFDFLIDYERSNYTNRVLAIANIFLLPFVILAIYKIIFKIKQQNNFVQISFSLFGALLIGTSLYASYPRIDNYFNSRGYSTGENDIQAVNWIDNNTSNNYIVLANQQVSVAALNEFGFKKYYQIENSLGHREDIFYYPIPTGGSLYQYYLDMVYKKPSRATMEDAMNLVGVDTGYFVLNKYWWAFKKIFDEAKLEADTWKEFGDGEVYVFVYRVESL